MDTVGSKGAHTEIQSIKIATSPAVGAILDKAIQLHGATGSARTSVTQLRAGARIPTAGRRLDEVHERSLARRELARHRPPNQSRGAATASTRLQGKALCVRAEER